MGKGLEAGIRLPHYEASRNDRPSSRKCIREARQTITLEGLKTLGVAQRGDAHQLLGCGLADLDLGYQRRRCALMTTLDPHDLHGKRRPSCEAFLVLMLGRLQTRSCAARLTSYSHTCFVPSKPRIYWQRTYTRPHRTSNPQERHGARHEIVPTAQSPKKNACFAHILNWILGPNHTRWIDLRPCQGSGCIRALDRSVIANLT